MKRKIVTQLTLLLLVVAASFSACKKDEDNNPGTNNQNTVNRKPDLIKDKWVVQKVYLDGQAQQSHFLEGAIYQFYDNGSYAFLIPGAGSASGKWSFDDTQQTKLKLEANSTTGIWNIVTLTGTDFSMETKGSDNKTWRYEMKHP